MPKVMVIDGGARGHALAQAYLQTPDMQVLVAPGNDGMRGDFINGGDFNDNALQTDRSVSLKNVDSMLTAADSFKPDFIDVAQDDALAAGAVDRLTAEGFNAFGPTKAAAEIEWDKGWARDFMARHNIPRPQYCAFDCTDGRDHRAARDYAESLLVEGSKRVFFKATGLCAGKGVVSATRETIGKALMDLTLMGSASDTFLVEEGMEGEEFSYFAMSDGKNAVFFKSSQDNKRLLNGDDGPNTGGMGAHSPALVTDGLEARIQAEIIIPTLKGLRDEGRPYKGILYLGGMVLPDRSVKVVEFNSRWGDPECHVILPGITRPTYFELVNHAMAGTLNEANMREDRRSRVSIVAASLGYPTDPKKGKIITLDYGAMQQRRNTTNLLSAGVEAKEGNMYTSGGRVFSVVGSGHNTRAARTEALQVMACYSIEGGFHYRTDIAQRDIDREQKG